MSFTRREMLAYTVTVGAGAIARWRPAFAVARPVAEPQRTRPIPSSGEKVPCVGLGTSQTFNVGEADEQRAPLKEVLRQFHEMGGTILDTAPSYGNAEVVAGDLIRDLGIRDDMFIATKVRTEGRDKGIAQMNDSLGRLHVERVDLMQVHNLVDTDTQLATLRAWKDQGRIRYLGITTSRTRQYDDFEKVMKAQTLDFVQLNYSIGQREAAERLLPLARDRGMAVLVNLPFQRGRLFRAVGDRPLPDWAAEFQCGSWAQFFLKYVLANQAVTAVIPATSNPRHLADNMGAGLGALPDEKTCRTMEQFMASL